MIDANREFEINKIEFLSCFFPAFNEQENITAALDEAMQTLPRFAQRFEIVVVNDGSSDDTATIVAAYGVEHPEVRLVSHETNLGYGHALRTGFEASKGDAVFFTDADRQFRLEEIDRLIGAFETHPVSVGFRIKRNDPWHRLVVAAVYHTVLRVLFKLKVHDVDCAFKLFRRDVLDVVVPELKSRSAFISPELMIRARNHGFGVAEAGVNHHPRTAGRPKGATPTVIARTISEIIRLRPELRARKR